MSSSATTILAVNCGSSSVKVALLEAGTGRRELSGKVENVTEPEAVGRLHRGDVETTLSVPGAGHPAAVRALLNGLLPDERGRLAGVGHRIVHGGDHFCSSTVIDDATLETLSGLVRLAPLHMPSALSGLAAARSVLPEVPHVAVFDTAFHSGMPPAAARYAVPQEWFEAGVRRYGFHGISHRYATDRMAQTLAQPLVGLRMVTLHLGNGSSATAVRDGRSVDTSMGFTPLEGLMMGTRSGDVDPAILPYLASRTGRTAEDLVDDLNRRSGLLGVSGVSNDIRRVTAAAQAGSEDAALALDMFCYRAAKAVGQMAVAAGGLDVLVFTGGIGENSPLVRREVMRWVGHLGVHEDRQLNERPADGEDLPRRVSAEGWVTAWVVPADEERLIASETAALVG